MKKLLAIILAAASVFSLATFSASAETSDENTIVIVRGDVEYIFEADASEDLINSFIESCENEEHNHEETSTYGILCTLLGHKLESSTVQTITHNARTSAPRCLRKTYTVETCSRCDYSTKTLIRSTYIYCC